MHSLTVHFCFRYRRGHVLTTSKHEMSCSLDTGSQNGEIFRMLDTKCLLSRLLNFEKNYSFL